MFHLLYILAFAVLAVLAVANLVRNLMMLGSEARRPGSRSRTFGANNSSRPAPHPELLDDQGQVIDEPLIVMRSISVRDVRDQLDDLYDAKETSSSEESDD
ncbi:hypothetical protein XM38_002690 [Halomicronema hongdechloris C2206]|uniref:DUF2973 domain-containing protein n=1 Tax=Halomicronema hongdechloris C2206 TaxID=1641165 RepID=A0A1Z3HGC2_9CYAN|nr:DUF2973 domain-containing protein [Halomicronema hongdechloris]ASC69342.1 hypothetical protein XM38_002690 [Halomicronema hongdechloris C2206]